MDEASLSAITLLSALAESRKSLFCMIERLRNLPEVRGVHFLYGPEVPYYHYMPTYVQVCADMSVDLISGKSVEWVYYLSWDERFWKIEAAIETIDDNGSTPIQMFSPRFADTLEGCIQIVEEVTKQLLHHEDAWRQAF